MILLIIGLTLMVTYNQKKISSPVLIYFKVDYWPTHLWSKFGLGRFSSLAIFLWELSFCQKSLKILKQFILFFHFSHDCIAFPMFTMCPHCQSKPCKVTKHENLLREETFLLPEDVLPSLGHKHLYHVYTKSIHGILGKHNHQKSLNA